MTAEQRSYLKAQIDAHRRAAFRRHYGKLWHAAYERLMRDLDDRAGVSFADVMADRRLA